MAVELAENDWQVSPTYKHERLIYIFKKSYQHKNIVKIKCDLENLIEVQN